MVELDRVPGVAFSARVCRLWWTGGRSVMEVKSEAASLRDVTGKSIGKERLSSATTSFYEPSSKRRKGFPSETNVRRGLRVVHGEKELLEKLGRNDPCPCGSGRRFQEVLHARRTVRRSAAGTLRAVSGEGHGSRAVPFFVG